MTKYQIGNGKDSIVWEALDDGSSNYSYLRKEKSLNETQEMVLDELIKYSIIHDDVISLATIAKKLDIPRSTVASAMAGIKDNPNWTGKILTTTKGSRINNVIAITDKEANSLQLSFKKGIKTKKERTSKKDKQEHTMISDRADLIGCCYPDIRDAIICSLTDDKSVYLSFNFDIDSAQGYPEFISAVFHFYEDLDVLEYYALNPKAVLRFEIDNTNSIQGLQIEFQTEFNRVVGPPYLVKLNPGSNHIDIPLSAYSKYTRDMQKIQNLCFVIKKENFVDLKGFVIISNISFVF